MTTDSPGRNLSRPRRSNVLLKLRTAVAVALTMALTAVASCSRSQAAQFDYFRVQVDGQSALGITKRDVMIRGVVIFFHGMDADEFALTSDATHEALTNKLVDAGFAVVSSRAGGNAFGNPASQQNYRELGTAAVQHYRIQNVFFLAESMGAIAAVNLLASVDTSRVRGLVAINPTLDFASAPPEYWPTIAANYPNESTDSVDPMKVPQDAFRDKYIRFYVSPDDSLVRPDANALAFQARFGSVADISIVGCSGRHGDPSCFQGDDIIRWFTQLERRVQP